MTIIPISKVCTKCHKKYTWNPDVGKIFCPYCHGLGEKKNSLFRKRENTSGKANKNT